jgi:hypothetical protein
MAVNISLTANSSGSVSGIIFTDTTNGQSTPYNIDFYSDPQKRKNRFIGDVLKDGLKEIKYHQLPSGWQRHSDPLSGLTPKQLLDIYYKDVDDKTEQYEKSYLRILKVFSPIY